MIKTQTLIVGGGACGAKCAARLSRISPSQKVILTDSSEIISYGACSMPYYLRGDFDNLASLWGGDKVRDASYFKEKYGTTVFTKTKLKSINLLTKEAIFIDLNTSSSFVISYENMVLATGASAYIPNIPGVSVKGIYTFKHPYDAKTVRTHIEEKNAKKAVVLGASLVGIEVAEALVKRGIKVSLIEKKKILDDYFDEELSSKIKEELLSKGVLLREEEEIRSFSAGDNGFVKSVLLKTGETISTDMVVLATGFKPNIKEALDASLVLTTLGTIEVNKCFQTSDKAIYAGGDVIANINSLGKREYFPAGDTANIHGRLIADNIVFGNKEYKGMSASSSFELFGKYAGKTGVSEKYAIRNGYDAVSVLLNTMDRPSFMKEASPITLKLIADAKSRKVLGAQAFGKSAVLWLNTCAMAIKLGAVVDDISMGDFAYNPSHSTALGTLLAAAHALENKIEKMNREINPSMVAQRIISRLQEEIK